MNFGDILDRWEKQTPKNRIYDKDIAGLDSAVSCDSTLRKEKHKRRVRLLGKKPDAAIDLHGLNCDEAWAALDNFFENSRQEGFEKVLVIHGKGNHNDPASPNARALRDLSRRFIESCPFAGENGVCSARDGGSGATWVILK